MQTSNLVLTAERGKRSDRDAPSSEVTSLSERSSTREMVRKMGDRSTSDKSKDLSDRLSKSRKKRELEMKEGGGDSRKRRRGDEETVLTAVVETIYQPKTRETKAAYEVLLSFIQKEMGAQPHDVLRSCADEVLSILKDEDLKQKAKQGQVSRMLGVRKLGEEPFARLVNIGTKITDYKTAAELKADKIEGQFVSSYRPCLYVFGGAWVDVFRPD